MKNMQSKVCNKNGFVLIFFYVIVVVIIGFGLIYYYRSVAELKIAEKYRMTMRAFSVAEAGLERALYVLRRDYDNDPSAPSWADGDINGMVCGPDTQNFYPLPLASPGLDAGVYVVELKNVAGKDDEIWIRSSGTVEGITQTVQAYLKISNISPWQHVIFGGTGAAGAVINGNVAISGSVHVLGEGLSFDDYAMSLSGTADINNNYSLLPAELMAKIPPCPMTQFNGEWIESLGAELRVKHGKVGLSGTAFVGDQDIVGNSYKETADGVFVTDGFGGEHGAVNVYSDNGTENLYDLGESVPFPSLSDPYEGYPTYMAYLRDNALVITDPAQLNQLANIVPTSSFNFSDARGSISMDGNGNLAISGIVYVDGGSVNFRKQGTSKIINYTGKGSLLVTGNVGIDANLYTKGDSSFPANIMGIMTPNTITFIAAQCDVMGLLYAENSVTIQKQTDIAGALVSNYFDMGTDVPSVFQVPSVIDNLPPGMIGQQKIWFVTVLSWEKL